jgi:signal transduction histidine kinase
LKPRGLACYQAPFEVMRHPRRHALFRVATELGFGLVLALALVFPAGAVVVELNQAQASVTVSGHSTQIEITLPYQWDRKHKGESGSAVFDVPFALPGSKSEPYAVYFTRLGNAYEIWLNGKLVERGGDLLQAGGADYAKMPRYIALSSFLLEKANVLHILIRADTARYGGVSAPLFGPADEVRLIYQRDYRWRLGGSLGVAIFSIVVGLLAFTLWWTQSQFTGRSDRSTHDPIYLLACVAELSWALRMGDALLENPPLPWPWWGIVTSIAFAFWIVCMTLFCHQLVGLQSRASNRLLGGVLVAGVLAACVAQLGALPWVWTAWLGVAAVGFVAYGCYYSFMALTRRDAARILVAVAVMFNVLAGLHDWLAVRLSGGQDGSQWIRYTSVLFGITLFCVVLMRFRQASTQAYELTQTLAARVAAKELELKDSFVRLEVLVREQERSAERTRILRDMHDGVGAHISTAIRQLQSGQAKGNEVLLTLRESLDQLKLSIDVLNLPAGDITALLANLRYRLEPRFKASDIELQWDVELLAPLPSLDDKRMRHLQFLVYGALANVLQHAGASMLRIEAQRNAQGVRVRIVDNGCGFDTTLPKRKGLLSMEERAKAIGATMAVRSAPGGTAVEFLIS